MFDMRRRDFVTLLGGVATWPLAARAQQPEKVRLIGVLMGFEADWSTRSLVQEFRAALVALGWKEGSNLRIEVRWGASDVEKIKAFAKELIEMRPDAILGQTTPAAVALAHETKTIPIVFVTVSDPIGSGLAVSLTRPGGNITGFTFVEPEMGGKWVQLLKEIAPRTTHSALLFNPATSPPLKFYLPSIESAASSLGFQVNVAPVHAKDEIEGIIAAQAGDSGGSIIVMPDAFNATNRNAIIASASRYAVPAIYGNNFTNSGGLIFYGADFAETFRLGAGYINRILQGTKPAELPIQLPTKFELAINTKTAKTLGLTVPESLLRAADEVIE